VFDPLPEEEIPALEEIIELSQGHDSDWELLVSLNSEMLDRVPGHPQVLFNLAVAYMSLEMFDDAEATISDVLDKHPGYLRAQGLQLAIHLTRGDMEEAESLLAGCKIPETMDPEELIHWYVNCANYHNLQDQYEEAQACIILARLIEPTNPMVLFAGRVLGF